MYLYLFRKKYILVEAIRKHFYTFSSEMSIQRECILIGKNPERFLITWWRFDCFTIIMMIKKRHEMKQEVLHDNLLKAIPGETPL